MVAQPEENTLSNDVRHINSQCKIVCYPWVHDDLGENNLPSGKVPTSKTPTQILTTSLDLDVSSQITGCTFEKRNQSPTGSFSFTLSNSPGIGTGDWKDILKRGTWCLIKMDQNGGLTMNPEVGGQLNSSGGIEQEASKIRCIGYIDRVSVKSRTLENGALDISYEVTGRDFGVVYSDTTIWHNVFEFDEIMLRSEATSRLNVLANVKLNEVLDVIHDLFYNPTEIEGAKVNDSGSLTTVALQWLLPDKLVRDLGFSGQKDNFWGSLPGIKNFSTTEAGIAVSDPVQFLTGNAWSNLRELAVTEFHELYTETTDFGIPQLVFRPIPFSINKSKYPTVGKHVTKYRDLNVTNFPTDPNAELPPAEFTDSGALIIKGDKDRAVRVPALDVIGVNLGEDNQNRYNSFLSTLASSVITTESNTSFLEGSGFPKHLQDSITRHGFRPMHVTVDTVTRDGKEDFKLAVEFNELLADYWSRTIFSESGSVDLIGRNDVKLGKVLIFNPDVPYAHGRRYYIEGYSDTFTIEENGVGVWGQTVYVTNGYEESDLQKREGEEGNFGERDTQFTHEGEFTRSGGI